MNFSAKILFARKATNITSFCNWRDRADGAHQIRQEFGECPRATAGATTCTATDEHPPGVTYFEVASSENTTQFHRHDKSTSQPAPSRQRPCSIPAPGDAFCRLLPPPAVKLIACEKQRQFVGCSCAEQQGAAFVSSRTVATTQHAQEDRPADLRCIRDLDMKCGV